MQGLEEVSIGGDAQALLPRIVFRLEIRIVRHALGQLLDRALPHHLPRRVREAAAELEEQGRQHQVLEPDDAVRQPRGQEAPEPLRGLVHRRHRHDIPRAPLQHRHALGLLRQDRQQRHGRGPAPDHHHLLALVVQPLGPELRVHHLPREPLDARHVTRQRFRVVIVPRAQHDKARPQHLLRPVRIYAQPPRLLLARPVRRDEPVAASDVPIDARDRGRLADVGAERLPARDDLLLRPGPPREGEGVEVRVGADAGVAEEVPGAADAVARFEDGVGGRGQGGLQPVGGVDAGDAGADDDDVEGGGGSVAHCSRSGTGNEFWRL